MHVQTQACAVCTHMQHYYVAVHVTTHTRAPHPPPPIAPPSKAIECFDSAGAVVVPRSRFAPVKTTSDLFLLRSDAYALTPAATVEAAVPKASWGTAGRAVGGGRQMMNRG